MVEPALLVAIGVGIGLGIGVGIERVRQGNESPPGSVTAYLERERQKMNERYVTTKIIDVEELEQRAELLLSPGTEQIMRDAVQVDGIGPHTAFRIAELFDGDYQAYEQADRETLESVNGVGENRATALLNR